MTDKSEDYPYAKYLKLKEPVEFKLSILDDEERKFWDHMEERMTDPDKENRIKKKLQDSLDSLKWNTWNRWSDPDLNDVYSNGMTGGVASFHDCVYEALNQSYRIEQLRDIFFSLPQNLILIANEWGLSDTEFREAVYSHLCQNS